MIENITRLMKQGQELREFDPAQSIKLFDDALILAKESNTAELIPEILFETGVANHNLSNHSEAAAYFEAALSLPAIEKETFLKANTLRCLSVQYIRTNNIEKAVKTLYESQQVSIQYGHDENLHMVESTFGSLYIQLKMFDKALEHELKSLELAEKLKISGTVGYSHLGIGSCYFLLNELEKAEYHLSKVFEDECTNFTLTNTYYYLSKLYVSLNQLDKALDAAIKGHKIAAENKIKDYTAISLGMIGKINILLGHNNNAIRYLNEAIAIAEEFDSKRIYFALYKDIIEAYGKVKDYKNQSEAYEKLYKYHTEYLEQQSKLKIKQLNHEFHIEQANRETELEKVRSIELNNALKEVRKLNEELEEVNREKNDFMAVAVHDLKNPLQNILSTARIIKATNNDNPELRDFADNIVLQTDRMFSLIRKLLDHSSLEQGKVKLKLSQFKAERLCREILNDFTHAASKKNQNLTYENNCNGDLLYTDYDILYQIMGNIVSNALKFSEKDKNIGMSSYTENGSVVFEVVDEGPGFTDEDMKNVFKKFSRLSAKPTNGENSTGLGLSISKKLTELIDAEIMLESLPGKGSKFQIKINRVSH
jgi:signal transduction histidine kinase